ncbi:RPM1-interacting protein 4 [Vigna radiata var. radiata]|uniref:RPM1-interacting protein 4 n=1 Tax=Vigna radiata var. radiata TaxID=3916 RepID=A0A3Q0FFQ6_VIGRR|nr:RPM1-interacting protein 4 [Vigna radiata var. radiata]
MPQHSHHVPKFGNWDSDNVPYTAYFEHARREKSRMVMMNPNDPMENPEALNNKCMRVGENMDDGYSHNGNSLENGRFGALGNDAQRHMRGRGRGSNGGSTTDFVSEQSQFDDSVNQRSPRSNHRRNISKGGSSTKSFSSSSHTTNKSRNTSFNDQPNNRAPAIPKFGTWDVTDPNSGEGYTAIFNKIKEERQIKSANITNTPTLNKSNIQNQYAGSFSWFSKYCCCGFQAKTNEGRI